MNRLCIRFLFAGAVFGTFFSLCPQWPAAQPNKTDPAPKLLARFGAPSTVFKEPAQEVLLSPDGVSVLVKMPGALFLIERDTGKQIWKFARNTSSFAFSPDGKKLAIGLFPQIVNDPKDPKGKGPVRPKPPNAQILVVDAATGKEEAQLEIPETIVHHLAITSDAKTLIAMHYREKEIRVSGQVAHQPMCTAHFWDLTARKDDGAAEELVGSYAPWLSPDGKTVTIGGRQLINVATRRSLKAPTRTGPGTSPDGRDVAFSPDGKVIAYGDKNTVRFWDVENEKPGRSFRFDEAETATVSHIGFSPNGKVLATVQPDMEGVDGRLRFWDVDTGNKIAENRIGGDVRSVRFSADGKQVLTASRAGVHHISRWDPATGQYLLPAARDLGGVTSAAFLPDNKTLLVLTTTESLWLWDAATGKPIRLIGPADMGALSFSLTADGEQVVTRHEQSLHIWKTMTGEEVRKIPLLALDLGASASVAFSPNGKLVAANYSEFTKAGDNLGRIALFDAETGKKIRTLSRANPTRKTSTLFTSLAFSPDGTRLAAGEDDEQASGSHGITVWDTASGSQVTRLFHPAPKGDAEYATFCAGPIAFSPDGKQIFSRSWERRSARGGPMVGIGGRMTFYENADNLVVWNTSGGKPGRLIELGKASSGTTPKAPETGAWTGFAASPDGKLLSIYDGETVTLFDTGTGKPARSPFKADLTSCAAFSPDGKWFFTGGLRGGLVWSLAPTEDK